MRASKVERDWAEFEELLVATPPKRCEVFAPRSGFADRHKRAIYKLLIRVKGSPDSQWCVFEDWLVRVPTTYVADAYPELEKNPAGFVSDSLAQLRHVEAESPAQKPALARALQVVRAGLEASPHLGNIPLNRTM